MKLLSSFSKAITVVLELLLIGDLVNEIGEAVRKHRRKERMSHPCPPTTDTN